MSRIRQSLRTFALAIASAALAACSDDATAPTGRTPNPTPVAPAQPAGRWVTQSVNGGALPRELVNFADDGITGRVLAIADTLTITSDGRYVQRARLRHEQSDGFVHTYWFIDHGFWTRDGDVLRFESNWIQNVRFTATLGQDGVLRVQKKLILDDDLAAQALVMNRTQ